MTKKLSLKFYLKTFLLTLFLFSGSQAIAASSDLGVPLTDDAEAAVSGRRAVLVEAVRGLRFTDAEEFLIADRRTATTAVKGTKYYGYLVGGVTSLSGIGGFASLAASADPFYGEFLTAVTGVSGALLTWIINVNDGYTTKEKELTEAIHTLVADRAKAIEEDLLAHERIDSVLSRLEKSNLEALITDRLEAHSFALRDGCSGLGDALGYLCRGYRRLPAE